MEPTPVYRPRTPGVPERRTHSSGFGRGFPFLPILAVLAILASGSWPSIERDPDQAARWMDVGTASAAEPALPTEVRLGAERLDAFFDYVQRVEPDPGTPAGPRSDPSNSRRQDLAPGGWAPYTGTFERAEAMHLLQRAMVGPRFEEAEEAANRGLSATLDLLLTPRDPLAPPAEWVNEPIPDFRRLNDAQRDSVIREYRRRIRDLQLWWVASVIEAPPTLTETMTHFYHDHFATGARSVRFPQTVYRQQELLRKHSLGNFKDLTRSIGSDPAMLIWLDGRFNIRGNPNENFARELMELFTMGVGSGYTQDDVVAGARACTGWTTDGMRSVFDIRRHDNGEKTILGETGRWNMSSFIDILFEQPATAEYVCTKLFQWFVHEAPAEADIAELARVFRESDYEVRPVLRTILGSEQFFDSSVRGGLVRDGLDIYAGVLRRFHIDTFDPTQIGPNSRWMLGQMEAYNHVLLDPPNVAGWPGHLNWINSQTLPLRKAYVSSLISGRFDDTSIGLRLDVKEETARLRDPNDPFAIVDDVALLCFGRPPTELVRQSMLDALLQGAEPYDWYFESREAPARLRDLYQFAMQLPDFQLK